MADGDTVIGDYVARPDERLLRDRDVATMLACCPRQVRELVKVGEIPPPIKVKGAARWVWGELAAVIERKVNERTQPPADATGTASS